MSEPLKPVNRKTDGVLAYPIKVAAWKLGIGKSLLYEEIGAGRIKTFHVGKRHLIRVEDLNAFVADRLLEAKAA